jgi:hypothetical protein
MSYSDGSGCSNKAIRDLAGRGSALSSKSIGKLRPDFYSNQTIRKTESSAE